MIIIIVMMLLEIVWKNLFKFIKITCNSNDFLKQISHYLLYYKKKLRLIYNFNI